MESKTHSTRQRWLWSILLLLLATALRLPHADWDVGIAAHPDERFLLGVAEATPLWGDVCSASSDFPYGHLPVYLARLVVMAAPGSDPLYATRLLSGLIGVLLVALAGAYGRALGGPRSGWLAAGLLALAPFPIQQARFYTVDPLGAVLASAAILATMRHRWRTASILAGLALACKLSLAWCAVAVLASYIMVKQNKEQNTGHKIQKPDAANPLSRFIQIPNIQHLTSNILLPLVVAFAVTSPWALLRPVACWRGPLTQAGMVAGRFDFPYTRQYAGTWPFVYPLAQMAWWGLGLPVTGLGLYGVARALWRWRDTPFAGRSAAVWVILYGLTTMGLFVKFPRYLLPLYPAWAAWAAAGCEMGPRNRKIVCSGLTVAFTAALGLAQASTYSQPHPWITASRWIYDHIPAGATLSVEMWDHALPVWLPDGDPTRYVQVTLPIFDEDSAEKQAQLDAALQSADVIILASRRGYAALARQPERYADTLAWYRKLLEEREIMAFGRCPHLGPLALSDDPVKNTGWSLDITLAERCGSTAALRLPPLDESWRVYDAPVVLLALKRQASP